MQFSGGFRFNGGFTFAAPATMAYFGPTTLEYLLVAGGGGGGGASVGAGSGGPGGGAGGVLTTSGFTVTQGSTITITVGSGGPVGTSSSAPTQGTNGADSVISGNTTVTAIGGGGGGASNPSNLPGKSGGSGGGGAYSSGGSGTAGQGYAGGNATNYPGAGGGGAGGVGESVANRAAGGTGGTGTVSTILGSNLGSVSFNGTSQYLSAPNNAVFNFGTSDFSVEFWLYCITPWTSQTNPGIAGQKLNDGSSGWQIYRNGSNNIDRMNIRLSGSSDYPATVGPTTGVWQHWAVVRASGTLTWYCNGVASGSYTGVTQSVSDSSGTFNVGSTQTWGGFLGQAYLSNLRIVNGKAVYTGNFTPNTAPLSVTQSTGTNISAITGTQTSVLLNMPYGSGYLTDSSTNNVTITNTGAAVSLTTNPFYNIAYAGGGGGGADSSPGGTASFGGGAGGASGVVGANGTAYTGGGGGGAGWNKANSSCGAGGSGVAVIRYPNSYADAASTTGSPTYVNINGYKTYIFTASGTIVF